MTYMERHIVDTYSNVLAGLSTKSKIELIERLAKSLKTERETGGLHLSFAAWDNKSIDEINYEIKSNRNFIEKDLTF